MIWISLHFLSFTHFSGDCHDKPTEQNPVALLMIAALLCLPVMAEAALVISATNSVPANNATGVSTSLADVTLTLNNKVEAESKATAVLNVLGKNGKYTKVKNLSFASANTTQPSTSLSMEVGGGLAANTTYQPLVASDITGFKPNGSVAANNFTFKIKFTTASSAPPPPTPSVSVSPGSPVPERLARRQLHGRRHGDRRQHHRLQRTSAMAARFRRHRTRAIPTPLPALIQPRLRLRMPIAKPPRPPSASPFLRRPATPPRPPFPLPARRRVQPYRKPLLSRPMLLTT